MAVFGYRGIVVATGKQVHGVRDADNHKVLRAALRREGILLTAAAEEKKGAAASGKSLDIGAFFRKITTDDIGMMTRQLATLVRAGIPLVEAVSALTEQVDKIELKRILTQVRDQLNEGSSLAKALEPHAKVFSNLYVNMIAAGEASGTLEDVLERLADYIEGQSKLKSKVSAALAYPVLMLVIGTVLISIMMIVVVPKVTSIFASLDRALPWYTTLLIAVSSAIGSTQMLGFIVSTITIVLVRRAMAPPQASATVNMTTHRVIAGIAVGVLILCAFFGSSFLAYGEGIILGVIVGYGVARLMAYLATPEGLYKRDSMMLQLPVFGSLLRMLAVARFSRTLSTLLKSGVPVLRAMAIVKNVLDNARLEKVIQEATGSIREGESIALPLKRSGDFPPIVIHMIAVGEKSGQLEQMLENVAQSYDVQVETKVQALTSLLEPLMIVIMGGSVGFIAFSILMPLIQLNDFQN